MPRPYRDRGTWVDKLMAGGGFATVTEFARAAGLGPDTVYTWQNGKVQRPKREHLERAAAAVGVPLADLEASVEAAAVRPNRTGTGRYVRQYRNRGTWVDELVVGGGFGSVAEFARAAGLHPTQVHQWRAGSTQRPRRRQIERAACASVMDPDELEAMIEAAATKPRGGGAPPRVERIEFQCVGYMDHRKRRFAKNCMGTVQYRPGELREAQKQLANKSVSRWTKQRGFYDLKTGTFRCPRCVNGARAIAMLEGRIRESVTRERIESGEQRASILEEAWPEVALWRVKPPGSAAPPRSRGPKPGLARTKIIEAWSADELPTTWRVGTCRHCSKLTFTLGKRPTERHPRCFREWRETAMGRAYHRAKQQERHRRWYHGDALEVHIEDYLPRRRGAPVSGDRGPTP